MPTPKRFLIAGHPVEVLAVKFNLAEAIDITMNPLTRIVTVRMPNGKEVVPVEAYRSGLSEYAKTYFVSMGFASINPATVLSARISSRRLCLITRSGQIKYPYGVGTTFPLERLAKAAGLQRVSSTEFARVGSADFLRSDTLFFRSRPIYIGKPYRQSMIDIADADWIECLDQTDPVWINPRSLVSLGHTSFTTANGDVTSLRILSGKMRVRLQNSVRWIPVNPHLSINPAQVARVANGLALFRTHLTSVDVPSDVAPLLRRLAARAAK